MTSPKPLTPRERRLWQAWEALTDAVASGIGRDLTAATGLSGADYAVLSSLVEAGEGTLRQRDLATALGWDKSRISHQLTRMQERDLLVRSKTQERGSRVEITPSGRQLFARARLVHAQAVRRHLFGRLPPAQAALLLRNRA